MTHFNEILVKETATFKGRDVIAKSIDEAKVRVKEGKTMDTLSTGIKFLLHNLTLIIL